MDREKVKACLSESLGQLIWAREEVQNLNSDEEERTFDAIAFLQDKTQTLLVDLETECTN